MAVFSSASGDPFSSAPFLQQPADAVQIDAGPFFDNARHIVPVEFQGNVLSQAFLRKTTDPVTIVVNATMGDGLQVELPDLRPGPTIVDFSASPPAIVQGGVSKLSWAVRNTEKVLIDNGIGQRDPISSVEVKPTANTTYKLTATNAVGHTDQTVTIVVNPPPPQPPHLDGAVITFRTERDDLDHDSIVEIHLKKRNGHEVAFKSFSGEKFEDKPPSEHSIGCTINREPATLDEIRDGILTIKMRANGNDHWYYKSKVSLHFNDGTTWVSGYSELKSIESNGSRWTGDVDSTFHVDKQ